MVILFKAILLATSLMDLSADLSAGWSVSEWKPDEYEAARWPKDLSAVQSHGKLTKKEFNSSRSSIWLLPAEFTAKDTLLTVRPHIFNITVAGSSCEVLQHAVTRYLATLHQEAALRANHSVSARSAGNLTSLIVDVNHCGTWPYADMDESYYLSVTINTTTKHPKATLSSDTVWGALRGLESFVQLLEPTGDGFTSLVRTATILDSPRFPHRGLMLDTARHYLPVKDIKLEISAMAIVKMNVLHWHIVDDQSFPWQSRLFPNLSMKGAFSSLEVYTPEDVQDVVNFARLHGIRVIPEFDTPGHTKSWEKGRPELLAECYTGKKPTGKFKTIDPTNSTNLRFLRELFGEITTAFPEQEIHLGGDEVSYSCWRSDPSVLEYLAKHDMSGSDKYHKLEFKYMSWLQHMLSSKNRSSIVWQDAWQYGNFTPGQVDVQVWKGAAMEVMKEVTEEGFRELLSEGWYLSRRALTWRKMYSVDPQNFYGSVDQLALVRGGEACLWSEHVTSANVHRLAWPRAAAVAERLWSPRHVRNLTNAAKRIDQLVCRLRRRGIPASFVNGEGAYSCLF